jgi:hypothetical protein
MENHCHCFDDGKFETFVSPWMFSPLATSPPTLVGMGLAMARHSSTPHGCASRFRAVPTGVRTQVVDVDQHPSRRPPTIGAAPKNARRQAAGKRNQTLRRGLSEAGRERLRAAARNYRPWQYSTGPRTPTGKAIAAANSLGRDASTTQLRDSAQALKHTSGDP